jgi:hypothetical protein
VRSTCGRRRSCKAVAALGSPRVSAARSSLSSSAGVGVAVGGADGAELGTSHSLAPLPALLVDIPGSTVPRAPPQQAAPDGPRSVAPCPDDRLPAIFLEPELKAGFDEAPETGQGRDLGVPNVHVGGGPDVLEAEAHHGRDLR